MNKKTTKKRNSINTILSSNNCLKFLLVLLIGLFAFSLFAEVAEAAPLAAVGNSMKKLFAFDDTPSFGDFLIFMIIYCFIAFMGLQKFRGEGNNAAVYLAVLAIGAALTGGLVFGGKITVTKLLPISVIILFFALMGGLFWVIRKVLGEGAGKAIIALVLALILSCVIFYFLIVTVCNDNSCNSNSVLKKMFGSDSILGHLGLGDISSSNSDDKSKSDDSSKVGEPGSDNDPRLVAATKFLSDTSPENLEDANLAQGHIVSLNQLKSELKAKTSSQVTPAQNTQSKK
ncbi:hypothetical protein HN587_04615 [Candidatus Woesearchaeota archaeon]|jgi:hypothetical protein|nr:hypothetical protein [Candidatus Woesearchaeota archaeon]